jgi:hypothetical protein
MDRGKGYNLESDEGTKGKSATHATTRGWIEYEDEPERPSELPTEVYPLKKESVGFDEVPEILREHVKPEETERAVEPKKNPMSAYTPHIILGVVALLSIVALAAMAYAPGTETQFIQNTLGSIALAATAALAGIIKGPGT